MSDTSSYVSERERTSLRPPKRYAVMIHNDDFTPMDLVVEILMSIFSHDQASAENLMLKVHHSDKAVAGVYSFDIAQSKCRQAVSLARSEGYPLRLTVEPAIE